MAATSAAPPVKSPVESRVETKELTILYDGTCGFCTRQARFAQRLGGEHVRLASTADPRVLERYPNVSREASNRQMYVQEEDTGRRYGGAAAVARLLREVPIIGLAGWLYYVPILHQIADGGYRVIARNRHRLSRVLGWQALPDDSCADAACAIPQRPTA